MVFLIWGLRFLLFGLQSFMSHFAGCDVRMEDAMNLKLLNFFHYLDVLIDAVH